MSNGELHRMQVVIAGRSYPIRVHPSDTEVIKKIVDEINSKVRDYQSTYANKDKQDCLAMALLTYGVDLYRNDQSEEELSEDRLVQKIDQIEDFLSKYV